jgi:hypothetical protein
MASNFIPLYVQYFPHLEDQAMNCQLVFDLNQDFCEDDDSRVRKEAIKSLVLFSTHVPKFAPRVADVLIQLLQTESQEELKVVRDTLLLSFQTFSNDSSIAMFHQLQTGSELVKNGVARFTIQVLLPVASQSVKLEFLAKFMEIIDHTPISIREVEIIMHILESAERKGNVEYNANLNQLYLKIGAACLDLRISSAKQKVSRLACFFAPLFQSGVSSGPFLFFLLTRVLDPSKNVMVESRQQLDMLQYVATNIKFCTNFDVISDFMPTLERLLIIFANDLSPSSTTVKLSTLKIEPVLFCILYFRVKIPNANRENSLAFSSALHVCVQTTQQMIHLANQSKNLPAVQLKLILKSTQNSLAICKVLYSHVGSLERKEFKQRTCIENVLG